MWVLIVMMSLVMIVMLNVGVIVMMPLVMIVMCLGCGCVSDDASGDDCKWLSCYGYDGTKL